MNSDSKRRTNILHRLSKNTGSALRSFRRAIDPKHDPREVIHLDQSHADLVYGPPKGRI